MPQLSSRRSTVARQILVLQVLVVVVVVVGAVTLAYADARRTQLNSARDRALAVAVSVADTPQVRDALRTHLSLDDALANETRHGLEAIRDRATGVGASRVPTRVGRPWRRA